MRPPPLRVVIISSPQVGYAITDRIVNMPQEGVSITGPLYTQYRRTHFMYTFSHSINALPLAITVLESIDAPPDD
jgi:hypothetical protein